MCLCFCKEIPKNYFLTRILFFIGLIRLLESTNYFNKINMLCDRFIRKLSFGHIGSCNKNFFHIISARSDTINVISDFLDFLSWQNVFLPMTHQCIKIWINIVIKIFLLMILSVICWSLNRCDDKPCRFYVTKSQKF